MLWAHAHGCTDTTRRAGLWKNLGFFRAFCTVLGTRLLAVFNTLQVERTANDVVTNTRQVFDTTTAHKNDRVFLQVVAFTADVRNDFETVGKTYLGDFTQSRVRFFRGCGVHACANTTTLRAVFERGALAVLAGDFARLAHELANGWHDLYASCDFLCIGHLRTRFA